MVSHEIPLCILPPMWNVHRFAITKIAPKSPPIFYPFFKPYEVFMKKFANTIICGNSRDVLKKMPDESIDMIMTSPPYWGLRDYGMKNQIGLETMIDDYIQRLCDIFDEGQRVLKKDGTCWVNLGDTYASKGRKRWTNKKPSSMFADPRIQGKGNTNEIQSKSLCQIPFRFSIEMTRRGWILRNVIIWHKPNSMPAPVKDRFTVDFEYLFFFVKSKTYSFKQQFEPFQSGAYDQKRMAQPRQEYNGKWAQQSNGAIKTQRAFMAGHRKGRNKRCVWKISTTAYHGAHHAVYPEELCIIPISAGCPKNGIVLDPFAGSGTTLSVAHSLGRKYVGIELNPKYIKLAQARIAEAQSSKQKKCKKKVSAHVHKNPRPTHITCQKHPQNGMRRTKHQRSPRQPRT